MTGLSLTYSEKTDGEAINRIANAVRAYPPRFCGNPLNLLFLDEIAPVVDGHAYLQFLDRPNLTDELSEVAMVNGSWPFPDVFAQQRPDPWELTLKLPGRLDFASKMMPTQRTIGQLLECEAVRCDADIIALCIVDGLSYYDLPDGFAEPCLVQGPTITEFGYRAVVGRPSISQRLFAKGYRKQLGITYHDPDANDLAGSLFELFSSSQIERVRTFEEALTAVRLCGIERGFIQITAPGLDGLCHKHQDAPPRAVYLQNVLDRFTKLVDCIADSGRSVLACLTSDHGIFWRDKLAGHETIIADLPPSSHKHPRYAEGAVLRSYTDVVRVDGRTFSLLTGGHLTRNLRANEWGVHGGLSAWESIVPLKVVSA